MSSYSADELLNRFIFTLFEIEKLNNVAELIDSSDAHSFHKRKELLLSGLDEPTTRELLDELRLDVRAHDTEAAYASAALHAQTRQYGRGLGDRSCLALAVQLDVPALTADREWKKVKVKNLKLQHIR